MDSELEVVREESHPLTAMKVVAQVRLIQEVMQSVMKEGTHYGVIPGCNKPSLWKPGAEKLLVTFRIGSKPIVEDLSSADVSRYRVTREGFCITTGVSVGSAVGECSSEEEKFNWRGAVCEAEYDATPEDRRRLKYKRDGTTINQVRTNHADVANTVLKMADKRSYVALALNSTAAGDIFTQDIEDLPAEVAASLVGNEKPAPPASPKPKAKADDAGTVTFIPAEVSKKEGEKNGKKWVKFGIKNEAGEWFGTFDTKLGDLAEEAKIENYAVTISYKIDGQYKNIVTLEKAAL